MKGSIALLCVTTAMMAVTSQVAPASAQALASYPLDIPAQDMESNAGTDCVPGRRGARQAKQAAAGHVLRRHCDRDPDPWIGA